MKNIIIGTAGHVDHGKTALIKALTGIDTDRLKEEKKRGITIELGFAHLDFPEAGIRAGIVDVPGHERFIKNMLAGAGGIDLCLLIVAADDGVMPQTREHLDILRLLDIREGIIALTKCDLADDDLIALVSEDIRGLTAGTFLADAPIVPVSAHTGAGLDTLKATLTAAAGRMEEKNLARPFRLPVDRVFTMEGFGTVVTGTLIEGTVREGDEVSIYPAGTSARVRSLQVHSTAVAEAFAGQRVAVNLSGIKREDIERGGTLAAAGSMEPGLMLDVRLDVLQSSPRTVKTGSHLHFYHGARDILCKAVLLEHDALTPGQSGYAQLRFSEPVAARKDDRFVVRFYSPVETVGGGVVLDASPRKHRRKAASVLEALAVREAGSPKDNLLQAITDGAPRLAPVADAGAGAGLDSEALKATLESLVAEGQVFMLTKKTAVSADFLGTLSAKARLLLAQYHADNPLMAGMRREELRARLLPGRDTDLSDKTLALIGARGDIALDAQRGALPDFTITYSERDRRLADAVAGALLADGGFAPPELDAIAARFPKDKAALKGVCEAMQSTGDLVLTSPGIHFHGSTVREALDIVRRIVEDKGEMTLADFRDAAGTSRKYALSLLEYFDRKGITQKVGDARVLKGRGQ